MNSFGRNSRIAAMAMVVIVLVIYQACYSFSFFPVTEGWFSEYGILIRSGYVPYRDFPLLMTPLYPALVAIVQVLFGEGFLPLRVIGVVLTVGMGLTLWKILAEFFNPWASAFGAVVAVIYYQSGVAFINYDFTQVVTMLLLLAVYFMLLDVDSQETQKPPLPVSAAFLAGLFLSAAVMTKQSNGGVASLVLSVVYVFVITRVHGRGRWVVRLLQFSAGLLSIVVAGIVVLAFHGAIGDFMQQVVTDAIRAKGGSGKIFMSWISGILTSPSLVAQIKELVTDVSVMMAATLLPYLLIKSIRKRVRGAKPVADLDGVLALLTAVIGLLLVVVLVVKSRLGGFVVSDSLRDQGALVYNNVILLSLFIYLAGTVIASGRLIWKSSAGTGKWVLLFSFGLALMVANGTSAGLSEISAFAGLGIAISFLMSMSVPFVVSSVVPIGIALLLMAFLVEKKFSTPYAWWSAKTMDVRSELLRVENDDILGGIGMEGEKYEQLRSVASMIQAHTREGDRIYVFPHMPVFNIMSHRLPYCNVVVSWFDFMNVRSGEVLVEKLEKSPPKVLVVARMGEEVFATHERLFNNTMPCIQRKIVDEINLLEQDRKIYKVKKIMIDEIVVDLYFRAN